MPLVKDPQVVMENAVAAAQAQTLDVPPQVAPRPGEFSADLQALFAQSDKDLRIMYQGIYQAVQQSAPVFATGVVRSLDHWHEMVEKEVDYYIRRILERAKKS